jgi:hypothetical protein
MPVVDFGQLPSNARIWIFASSRPLQGAEATYLLEEVDRFLTDWKAHGVPLRSSREWREDRFLVVGVDPTAEQASGCSIDGLFRGLRELEQRLATTLLEGGRVFYRDAKGKAQVALRKELPTLSQVGVLTSDTPIFDVSLTDAATFRSTFVRPARETWVGPLLAHASQSSSRAETNSSSVRKG